MMCGMFRRAKVNVVSSAQLRSQGLQVHRRDNTDVRLIKNPDGTVVGQGYYEIAQAGLSQHYS